MLGALICGVIGGYVGASAESGSRTEIRTVVKREGIDYQRLAKEIVYALKQDICAPWIAALAEKKKAIADNWNKCTKCGHRIYVEDVKCIGNPAWPDASYDVIASCYCFNSRYRIRLEPGVWDKWWNSEENRYGGFYGTPQLTNIALNRESTGSYRRVWGKILEKFSTASQDPEKIREIHELEEKIANPWSNLTLQVASGFDIL